MSCDNEYYYELYKNKYLNSCDEINTCNTNIYNLKDDIKQLKNDKQRVRDEIKQLEKAKTNVSAAMGYQNAIENDITDIGEKTDDLSENFSGMIDSSDVKANKITDSYSDEVSNTKSTINNLFDSLKTKNNSLADEIENLEKEFSQIEQEIEDIDQQIRTQNSILSYHQTQKNNNLYNMEIYRQRLLYSF